MIDQYKAFIKKHKWLLAITLLVFLPMFYQETNNVLLGLIELAVVSIAITAAIFLISQWKNHQLENTSSQKESNILLVGIKCFLDAIFFRNTRAVISTFLIGAPFFFLVQLPVTFILGVFIQSYEIASPIIYALSMVITLLIIGVVYKKLNDKKEKGTPKENH
ncbi:MAG TPA: hypothetical protein PLI45_03695 [Candidatus Woesebacteria bacterium]|nr:hypothetical protein [Candidatus Woesebacteria bacterium]